MAALSLSLYLQGGGGGGGGSIDLLRKLGLLFRLRVAHSLAEQQPRPAKHSRLAPAPSFSISTGVE